MANECYNYLTIKTSEGETGFPEGFLATVVDENGKLINNEMIEGTSGDVSLTDTSLTVPYHSPWGPTQDWATDLSASFPGLIINIEYMETNMGLSGELEYRGGQETKDIEDAYHFVRQLSWGVEDVEGEVEELIERLMDDEDELTAILALPAIQPDFLKELHSQLKGMKEDGEDEIGETSINKVIKSVRAHVSFPAKGKKQVAKA
jgi:hypothetical protein